MSLLPFLSFFPFFDEPKPDGAKSDVSTCLPSNRNALSLPTINLLIILLSFSVEDSDTKVKQVYNWLVRPRRVPEDAKDVLEEPETMFRKHMQGNMSQDACQRFGQSKTPWHVAVASRGEN
jgi:hypothetical protein